MRVALTVVALTLAVPIAAEPLPRHRVTDPAQTLSRRGLDRSNGYGTNAANSEAIGRPVDDDGGYVVNAYGFGNYVAGPRGFGGYPAGSDEARIWRQREQWKCENVPESC